MSASRVTGSDFVIVKLADRDLQWVSTFKSDKNIFTNAIWTAGGGGGWMKIGTGPRRHSSRQHLQCHTNSAEQHASFSCEWELPQTFDLRTSLVSPPEQGRQRSTGASLVMWETLSSPKNHLIYGMVDASGFEEATVADSRVSQQHPGYWETEVRLKMSFYCMTEECRMRFERRLSDLSASQVGDLGTPLPSAYLSMASVYLAMAQEVVPHDAAHLGHVYNRLMALTFYTTQKPALPTCWRKIPSLPLLGNPQSLWGLISLDCTASLQVLGNTSVKYSDYSGLKIARTEAWLGERCTKWRSLRYAPPVEFPYAPTRRSYWRLPVQYDLEAALDPVSKQGGTSELLLVLCYPLSSPSTGVLYSSIDICRAVQQGLYDSKVRVPIQTESTGLWETQIHLKLPMIYMPETACRSLCQSHWKAREEEYVPSKPYPPWPDPLQIAAGNQIGLEAGVAHLYDQPVTLSFHTSYMSTLPKGLDAYKGQLSDYQQSTKFDCVLVKWTKQTVTSECTSSEHNLYCGGEHQANFQTGLDRWISTFHLRTGQTLEAPTPEFEGTLYVCPDTYNLQEAFGGASTFLRAGSIVFSGEMSTKPGRGGISFYGLDLVAAVRNGTATASASKFSQKGYWETEIRVVCPIIHLQRNILDGRLKEYEQTVQRAQSEGKAYPPWPDMGSFLANGSADPFLQAGHVLDQHLQFTFYTRQRLDLVAFSGTIPSGPRLGENGFDKPRTAGRGAEAHSENQSRPVRLLSFDAGGVRGLAQLKTLERILDTPMLAKKAPAEVFDLIVGSGSGGLIALLLGRLGLTIAQAMAVYKGLIFATPAFQRASNSSTTTDQPQSSVMFDSIIEILFQMKGLPMSSMLLNSSTQRCHTAIVTMRALYASGSPPVFRTYTPAHAGKLWKVEIRKLIRLCLAEFIQDEPMTIDDNNYLDGGFSTWNPASVANDEGRTKLYGERKVELLISIGSGVKQPVNMARQISAGVWGYTGKSLHALATSALSTHRNVDAIFRHNKDKYFRLDPPFVGDLPSNSISKDNLSQLTAISESWLDEHEQRDKFVEIASVLGDRE